MDSVLKLYIDGAWVGPVSTARLDVINPATEAAFPIIAMGNAAEVDRAMAAARRAFPESTRITKAEPLELIRATHAEYIAPWDDLADAVTAARGAPVSFANEAQVRAGGTQVSFARKPADNDYCVALADAILAEGVA